MQNRTEGKEWRLDAKAGQMRMRRIQRVGRMRMILILNTGGPNENRSHLQMRIILICKKNNHPATPATKYLPPYPTPYNALSAATGIYSGSSYSYADLGTQSHVTHDPMQNCPVKAARRLCTPRKMVWVGHGSSGMNGRACRDCTGMVKGDGAGKGGYAL